ncbi:MAG: 50S ribosomal protein L11 methyltransferase [Verrucomicrobiales bacterium]|nr:50S ribosomal protein L11 methyltransferase [Verrucomicrobiales bacterium]
MTSESQQGIYRWTKILRSESEVEHWQAAIEAALLLNAMISHIAGKKSWKLEIFDPALTQLKPWQDQFDGKIEHLSTADLLAMSQPAVDQQTSLLKIRDRIVITQAAASEQIEQVRQQFPKRIVLSYPPALAFGTGEHATTATCLRLICDFCKKRQSKSKQAWHFLDLGCGSGILSAAAKAMGASSVIGMDFDPMAIRAAHRLAEINGLQNSELIEADVLKWQPPAQHSYDLIVANIFHDVLIELFPNIPKWLKPDGELILSGILGTQEKSCLHAAEQAGFVFDKVVRKGKWSTAHGKLRA